MVLLMNGCATPALFDAVDTRSKVAISSRHITEEELQAKGIPYTKFDGYYMVDKTGWRKTRDYAVLGAGLPFTLVADGVIVVTIGAGVVIYCLGPEAAASVGNTAVKGK